MFAQVAVPLPLGPLSYEIPPNICIQPGDAVLVSVRRKKISGIVLSVEKNRPSTGTYEIKKL